MNNFLQKKEFNEIIPTDVSIFYENGKPYIKYIGACYIDGIKVAIEIPKIDLQINQISLNKSLDYCFCSGAYEYVSCQQQIHKVGENYFILKPIKGREVKN